MHPITSLVRNVCTRSVNNAVCQTQEICIAASAATKSMNFNTSARSAARQGNWQTFQRQCIQIFSVKGKKQREQDPARHIFEAPAKCSQCRQKTQQQNIIQCELCGLFKDLATMERMHARKICIACKHLSFAHCGVKYQEIESLVFRMNNSGVRGITIVVVEWVKTCGNEGEEMKY